MQREDGEAAGVPAPATLDDADANLVAYLRLLAESSSGGVVDEGDDHLLFGGGHEYPGPFTNGAIRKTVPGRPAMTPAELLARADLFFGALGRPYVTWVREHRDEDLDVELRRRGHQLRPPAEGNPLLVVHRAPGSVAVPGVRVRATSSEPDREAFVALLAGVYGLPGAGLELAQAVLISLDSLRHPAVRLHTAHLDGRLVGGVTSFTSGGVAQFEWLVTDDAVRGRGVGRALASAAVRDALGHVDGEGHGVRFGWCMASQVGAPLWQGIGFEPASRFRRYVAPRPAAPPTAAHTGSRPRRGAAAAARTPL